MENAFVVIIFCKIAHFVEIRIFVKFVNKVIFSMRENAFLSAHIINMKKMEVVWDVKVMI